MPEIAKLDGNEKLIGAPQPGPGVAQSKGLLPLDKTCLPELALPAPPPPHACEGGTHAMPTHGSNFFSFNGPKHGASGCWARRFFFQSRDAPTGTPVDAALVRSRRSYLEKLYACCRLQEKYRKHQLQRCRSLR